MQLTLSGNENPSGHLVLERSPWAGTTYKLVAHICPNPICQCWRLDLDCCPEPSPPAGSNAHRVVLDMDIEGQTVAPHKELEPIASAVAFANAVADEMTPADWETLGNVYLSVKRYQTDHADLDQLNPSFPPEVLEGWGTMVGYYEILPFAPPIEFESEDRHWLLDDQYCIRPGCDCQESVLGFIQIPSKAEQPQSSLVFRYDYDSGAHEALQWDGEGEPPVSQFLSELKQLHPALDEFFEQRHDQLKRLFRRVARPAAPRSVPRKIGRNEPCPCGSGLKYKKCRGKN